MSSQTARRQKLSALTLTRLKSIAFELNVHPSAFDNNGDNETQQKQRIVDVILQIEERNTWQDSFNFVGLELTTYAEDERQMRVPTHLPIDCLAKVVRQLGQAPSEADVSCSSSSDNIVFLSHRFLANVCQTPLLVLSGDCSVGPMRLRRQCVDTWTGSVSVSS